jgi:hypothetical protein
MEDDIMRTLAKILNGIFEQLEVNLIAKSFNESGERKLGLYQSVKGEEGDVNILKYVMEWGGKFHFFEVKEDESRMLLGAGSGDPAAYAKLVVRTITISKLNEVLNDL